jgi:hypothetical protein
LVFVVIFGWSCSSAFFIIPSVGLSRLTPTFLRMKNALLLGVVLLASTLSATSQVNSGSNGNDGAFNPTQNVEIDMADHPDGIYHYTAVNIPSGVTVTFKPNAANTPVVWLVQGECVIAGTVSLSGDPVAGLAAGAEGGPGGWRGGSGGSNPSRGQGPGGGDPSNYSNYASSGGGSFASLGVGNATGTLYGNQFLVPLIGGSGGGGVKFPPWGGGGGGGALLIAATVFIEVNGTINASGGNGERANWGNGSSTLSGAGSGGGIRLVSQTLKGYGSISASAGGGGNSGGSGRVRIDVLDNQFGGNIAGSISQGFQPIILPAPGQGIQLAIQSVAGVAVAVNPSGVLANPDVIVPAQQTNPVSIIVGCTNVPLNSEITIVVQPVNGAAVQAVGLNNAGTAAASTATVSLNMPRGGGTIYAKCVSGLAGLGADTSSKELRTKSLAQTGWTADGERFAKIEVTAALGGAQQIAYITESGKRYNALAAR